MSLFDEVCPARAGMIRDPTPVDAAWLGLPRTRGDDPSVTVNGRNGVMFAPHARG